MLELVRSKGNNYTEEDVEVNYYISPTGLSQKRSQTLTSNSVQLIDREHFSLNVHNSNFNKNFIVSYNSLKSLYLFLPGV